MRRAGFVNSSLLGDVVDRPAVEHADDERVQERAVVGRDDHRPAGRDVLAADAAEPEVEVEERLQDRARDPVDDRVDAALARALVQAVELLWRGLSLRGGWYLHVEPYPRARSSLQWTEWQSTRTRTLRGALAGAAAAGVWAAQQPLDKRVFGCRYDDAELLGRLTGADAAPAGVALHLGNGALFGAAVRDRRAGVPTRARGCAARPPACSSTSRRWPLRRWCRAGDAPPSPARVRASDVAPRAVRIRTGRARAAAQPSAFGAGERRGGRPPTATAPPSIWSPPTRTDTRSSVWCREIVAMRRKGDTNP